MISCSQNAYRHCFNYLGKHNYVLFFSFTSNSEDSVETDFLQFRGMAESSMLIQARSPARGMEVTGW